MDEKGKPGALVFVEKGRKNDYETACVVRAVRGREAEVEDLHDKEVFTVPINGTAFKVMAQSSLSGTWVV